MGTRSMHRGPCCGYPPLTPLLYDDPAAHPYALVADKEGVLDPGKGEVTPVEVFAGLPEPKADPAVGRKVHHVDVLPRPP